MYIYYTGGIGWWWVCVAVVPLKSELPSWQSSKSSAEMARYGLSMREGCLVKGDATKGWHSSIALLKRDVPLNQPAGLSPVAPQHRHVP